MLLAGRPHSNLDVSSKRRQKVHQALDGQIARLPAHQTGNVRLFDAQHRASLRLRKSPSLD